jgi:SAM-dependent methyltransferase
VNDTTELLGVRPSAGHLDRLTLEHKHLFAHGWMFQPGHTFERIDAYLDGQPVGPDISVSRPDVENALAWAYGARPSGFTLKIALEGKAPVRLDLVGRIANAPPARLSCFVPSHADCRLPQPPEHLARRVSKLHGPAYRAQGLKMFTDLIDQMARLRIPTTGRLLDWGCGCGRVASYFLARLPEARLVGCDIDGEAIEWCRRNLRGDFMLVDPVPPTPLADAAVDLIIACSVLTHLGAADQDRWLREMRRILAPGGSFLASTNADFVFQLVRHKRLGGRMRLAWQRLAGSGRAPRELSGIKDAKLDRALDGIAPSRYYRAVFQSRAHTIEVCSKYFKVLDYVERGLNGHQDLIILRRAGY